MKNCFVICRDELDRLRGCPKRNIRTTTANSRVAVLGRRRDPDAHMSSRYNERPKGNDAKIPQSEIARIYDAIAPIYDVWGYLTESRARRQAIELAGIRDGESVLEVAVGTGLAFRQIVTLNPHGRNEGLDLSEGMLRRAQQNLKLCDPSSYRLQLGTALKLPFPDGAFDLLMNSYMFDLLPQAEMRSVLQEFRRVLKPVGRLVLVNMTKPQEGTLPLYEWLYHWWPRLMGGCRAVELADLVRNSRFVILKRSYVQQLLFPSEIILARTSATGSGAD
jgi:ubiquinone/menaquinone biosynthesis C-methylase UbiE